MAIASDNIMPPNLTGSLMAVSRQNIVVVEMSLIENGFDCSMMLVDKTSIFEMSTNSKLLSRLTAS